MEVVQDIKTLIVMGLVGVTAACGKGDKPPTIENTPTPTPTIVPSETPKPDLFDEIFPYRACNQEDNLKEMRNVLRSIVGFYQDVGGQEKYVATGYIVSNENGGLSIQTAYHIKREIIYQNLAGEEDSSKLTLKIRDSNLQYLNNYQIDIAEFVLVDPMINWGVNIRDGIITLELDPEKFPKLYESFKRNDLQPIQTTKDIEPGNWIMYVDNEHFNESNYQKFDDISSLEPFVTIYEVKDIGAEVIILQAIYGNEQSLVRGGFSGSPSLLVEKHENGSFNCLGFLSGGIEVAARAFGRQAFVLNPELRE